MFTFLTSLGVIFSAVGAPDPGRWWPQFRGPRGLGVAEGDFPTHFGPRSNVVWRTDLPAGVSSPCIWGDRIFLTAFENNELITLGLSRTDGRVLWRRAVAPGDLERGGGNTSPAASTPCTDGEQLYSYFGSFGLLCFDFEGKEQWRLPLPTPKTQHGASTSPVLSRDAVLLLRDADLNAHLLAVDKRSGKVLWRTERHDARRGFSTPLVVDEPAAAGANSRELAVVTGTLRLAAYDVKTGQEVWCVRGLPNEMVASPTAGEGLIFAAGWTHGSGVSRMPTFDSLLQQGDRNQDRRLSREEAPPGPARQHFLYVDADKDGLISRAEWDSMAEIFAQARNTAVAVRPGGSGDVTATQVVWKAARGLPYVATPLCYRGRVYLLKNGGLVSCLYAVNGVPLYQEERLGALGDYYASPVAAGGKICVVSQSGVAAVFAAGDTLNILAHNKLDEPVLATPAIVAGRLYIRTATRLYAFGPAQP